MPARTKRASVAEDGTPINRRVEIEYPSSSSEEAAETGSETESERGAQEDTTRMNRNPNRKGKGVAEEETEATNEEDDEHLDSSEPTGLLPTMHFDQSQYEKKIKLATRCHLNKAVDTLKSKLSAKELKWFIKHPQFKHLFHMHLETKHKVQGMWMLFFHGAITSKKREAWFVVNGVPIRYSLREHGILSGLHCHNYPSLDWRNLGGLGFARRNFVLGSTITYEVVEHKFMNMGPCSDRLKMAVLYFLSSVLIGNEKQGEKVTGKNAPTVEPFFIRAVDDLGLCRTFPWGRISFENNLEKMNKLYKAFEGEVKRPSWVYPSFTIPLEILAFETIPELKLKYREAKEGASPNCPRMCTTKFQKHSVSGFSLSDLYDTLGTTKDIHSVLRPTDGERALCADIFDKELHDDRDCDDYIVESWMNRIFVEKKRVFLQQLYDTDVHAVRKEAAEKEVADQDGGEKETEEEPANVANMQVVSTDELEKIKKDMENIKDGMLKMTKSIEGLKEGFIGLTNLMGEQEKRLKAVESYVKSKTTYDSHFDPVSYDFGGGTPGGYGGTTAGDGGTTPGGGVAGITNDVETPAAHAVETTAAVESPNVALETPTAAVGDAAMETVNAAVVTATGPPEIPAAGVDGAGQSEGEEEEEEKDGEEVNEKGSEEGKDGEEGKEGEEGKKDEVVGEKRKSKPSDAKKPPYTTLTEEKKKRKKRKQKSR